MQVADGVSLAVRRWPGAGGVPFLLVHGLASNARMWDGAASLLGPGSVAAVDLRGHGQSDKPDAGYDFATVVADLVALIDGLGWSEPPVVVGQSWGGNVVLELAIAAPDRVRAIACVDGGTIELSQRFGSWDDCAEHMKPPVLRGLPAVEVEAHVRRVYADWPETGVQGMLANFEVRADGTIAPWLTLDRHMAILRSLYEHRPSTRWGLVKVPALLIQAVGDRAKEAGVETAVSAAADARVVWIEGDHDLHAQYPDRVASLLLELAS